MLLRIYNMSAFLVSRSPPTLERWTGAGWWCHDVCRRDLLFGIVIRMQNDKSPFSYVVAHFVQTLVQTLVQKLGGIQNPQRSQESGQAFPYIHVNDDKTEQNQKRSIMLMSELDM